MHRERQVICFPDRLLGNLVGSAGIESTQCLAELTTGYRGGVKDKMFKTKIFKRR